MPSDCTGEFIGGLKTNEAIHFLTILQENQQRNGLHVKPSGKGRVLININFGYGWSIVALG